MSRSVFREGGPYKTRKTGAHEYSMEFPIPEEKEGRIARQCSRLDCSPGYFKMDLGTGVTRGQQTACCPYCRHATDQDKCTTSEQERYATDLMMRVAEEGAVRMLKEGLGLGPTGRRRIDAGLFSVDLSVEPGSRPHIRVPVEEELQRTVICPHCRSDHAVFGLATWCPACRRDVFLTAC